jgi:hypothetical protein
MSIGSVRATTENSRAGSQIDATRIQFGSLTRISDLARGGFGIEPLGRERWRSGDYVLAEFLPKPGHGMPALIERPTGRMTAVYRGDLVLGALGRRAATLEIVGDWRGVGADGEMDLLSVAGIFGKATSVSRTVPCPARMLYRGHAVVGDETVCMAGCVREASERPLTMPVVLLIGTSMSAGKTTAAKVVIRELKDLGLSVVGAKLTGAGRYRDVLEMGDAGANHIFDFVDAGLPSTVCDEAEYRTALRGLLARIEATGADVVVAEVGASPLEPYNGDTAIREVMSRVRCLLLCASDPYAVVGATAAFGVKPDLVTGIAANTDAAVDLVRKLSGLPALDLLAPASRPSLRAMLEATLGLP